MSEIPKARSPAGRTKTQRAQPTARETVKSRIAAQRAERQRLERLAARKWRQLGHAKRHAYLEKVRRALQAEGFRPTPFQWRHKGHAFGLVKDLRDKQVHVRVYENGIIDAEVEVNKRFVEHLFSPRPSAHRELRNLLRKHGIAVDLVNEHYLPKVGAARRRYPLTRTKVTHVLGVAAAAVAVSVARLMLRRARRGT